jgi:hypothetical protein
MPIVPDTKNWTWVIERPCDECGFDATAIAPEQVAGVIRANAAAWPAVLAREDAAVRPDDSTWSPLEYGAHVRDVFRIFHMRLGLMLALEDPLFVKWDQDETAIVERYNEQDPAVVGRQLVDDADTLAALFEQVPADGWSRTGRRGDGAEFTIASFGIYLAHDPIHHLWDVRG